MHNTIEKCRQICSIARGWIVNPRMLLMGCVAIFIYTIITEPLLKCSRLMNSPINILEPFVGLLNSGVMLALLPIMFIVLIADFPKVDGNMYLLIPRIGRMKWVLGQLLFLIEAEVTFIAFLFLSSILPILGKGFFYNGWSDIVVEFKVKHPELSYSFAMRLIPENIYCQMPPYKATILSIGLMFIYLFLIGVVLLLFQQFKHKKLGFVISIVSIVVGAATAQFDLGFRWILPTAHAMLVEHYTSYYRKLIVPFGISLCYLLGIVLVCIGIILFHAKHINFESVQETD